MIMKPSVFSLFFFLLIPLMLPAQAFADSAAEAADRIKERLPMIDTMKAAGEVGENAKGFLEARKPVGPRQTAVIEAENADRGIIYDSVARKTGQSPQEVGQQRAIRITELARAGVWLQKPSGEWYQKP